MKRISPTQVKGMVRSQLGQDIKVIYRLQKSVFEGKQHKETCVVDRRSRGPDLRRASVHNAVSGVESPLPEVGNEVRSTEYSV